MLTKIFLGALGIAVVVMAVFAFLSYNSLQSMGFPPPTIADSFDNYSNLYWTALWISGAVLLILSNFVFFATRHARFFWISFVFFAAFVLLQTWFLSDLGFNYKKINGLGNGAFNAAGIGGIVICLAVGIGIFCNQFIANRIKQKFSAEETVPSKQPEIE